MNLGLNERLNEFEQHITTKRNSGSYSLKASQMDSRTCDSDREFPVRRHEGVFAMIDGNAPVLSNLVIKEKAGIQARNSKELNPREFPLSMLFGRHLDPNISVGINFTVLFPAGRENVADKWAFTQIMTNGKNQRQQTRRTTQNRKERRMSDPLKFDSYTRTACHDAPADYQNQFAESFGAHKSKVSSSSFCRTLGGNQSFGFCGVFGGLAPVFRVLVM